MEVISQYIPQITQVLAIAAIIIAALAFVVSMIVQVFKNVSFLKKIPTDLVVMLLAIILALVALFTAGAIFEIRIVWYMVIAAIVPGFFVAFISMFGWEKLRSLWSRHNPESK